MRNQRLIYAILLLWTFVEGTGTFAAAAAKPSYIVTDLGTLGGTGSTGLAINASGQVTGGASTIGDAESHAFVWTPTTPNGGSGVMHDIGTLGGTQSQGVSINASGQVTGDSLTAGDQALHAFMYDGTMHDLGAVGDRSSNGTGINDSGHIVGVANDTATYRAFLYDGERHYLLSDQDQPSAVAGINASGQVIINRRQPYGSFLWTPTTPNGTSGTVVSLGHLSGFETNANAINNSGQVTGEALPFSAQFHAFFYDGTMHDVGTLAGGFSNGWAINNSGQITGEASTADGTSVAFLYTSSGGMVDLNTLIDPASGWHLNIGRGINDAGQITGYGYVGDDQFLHGFLLTPVPEPVGGMFILISAIPLLWRARRDPRSYPKRRWRVG
jgi:probable HAF family extracellular repeat protein